MYFSCQLWKQYAALNPTAGSLKKTCNTGNTDREQQAKRQLNQLRTGGPTTNSHCVG